MNTEQYRQIRRAVDKIGELERRLAEQEARQLAACEVLEALLTRKAGRPSKTETDRIEELQARMNGATH